MANQIGPCANYRERRAKRVEAVDGEVGWTHVDGKLIGFKAVGEGWWDILKRLDEEFARILGEDVNKLAILQIKEKFGGLRVYIDHTPLSSDQWPELWAAVQKAEGESFKTCELCGSKDNIDSRGPDNQRFGRTLTLCEAHHAQRAKEGKLDALGV